jgi:hypothetical protein
VGDDESADICVPKSTDAGASVGATRGGRRGVLHLVYGEGARVLYTRSADGARFERPRGLALAVSADGGGSFKSAEVPGSAGYAATARRRGEQQLQGKRAQPRVLMRCRLPPY